ncbi:hypothetical protein AVS7_00508 [Acidovorax sp. MR-S7]|nr:hypothetical protein AVS7_00508 [Acidovorax sp. MR-S7]
MVSGLGAAVHTHALLRTTAVPWVRTIITGRGKGPRHSLHGVRKAGRRSAPAQEKRVELFHRELAPGGAPVVALVGALRHFHLA